MRIGSVCSGIEAASLAWRDLGWDAAWFSEIEPFACAALAHHHPDVPNLGDMTTLLERLTDEQRSINLLVGGTPCQSFSVAGLRGGLADPRGNLALVFLGLVASLRPRWVVWENVPGVRSSGHGRDFGSFLGGLGELGYGWAYRSLDAQYFGLAQRRERVFVVGHSGGSWQRAWQVLFEPASLRGDPPPRRETGEGATADLAPSLTSSGRGVERTGESQGQDPVIAMCLNGRGGVGRMDSESETLIAHALRADGFDASEDGTGRGTPIVPILAAGAGNANSAGIGLEGDPMFALDTTGSQAIAFHARQDPDSGPVTHPLDTDGTSIGVAVPVALRGREGGATIELGEGAMHTLRASKGGGDKPHILTDWRVRRLMPVECERLQGFPDSFTAIPYRGKPAADGPRYRALGNSMAVPVMGWIGRRIAMVDAL